MGTAEVSLKSEVNCAPRLQAWCVFLIGTSSETFNCANCAPVTTVTEFRMQKSGQEQRQPATLKEKSPWLADGPPSFLVRSPQYMGARWALDRGYAEAKVAL